MCSACVQPPMLEPTASRMRLTRKTTTVSNRVSNHVGNRVSNRVSNRVRSVGLPFNLTVPGSASLFIHRRICECNRITRTV